MKLRKYYLFFLLATIAFSGCKKELDLKPTDTFDETNAFQTMTDLQAGVYDAYGRYATYGNDMYVNALVSDEAKIGSENGGQGLLTYTLQYSSDATTGGDVIAAFYGYYSLIDQVNRVLSYVPKVSASASEEPRRDILKGQLLALRAIAHFGLLENYCKKYDASDPLGVPIMLQSDVLGKPSRNSVGDVMAQIEKDLNDAKALLPDVTAADFSDTVMNKINIAAYSARIALYRGDWDAAINYSTEVINSGVKPLVSGQEFSNIWIEENSNETLFRIRFLGASVGGLWAVDATTIYIAPSDKLVATYSPDDIRLTAYIGGEENKYVNKFFASSRGPGVVDIKACQIAEMYLIRAEAYAKKASPDIAAGAADLNLLRASRITGYVDETYTAASTLIADVLLERYKELCFEGFRFFDLKRNDLPLLRSASDANPEWQTLPSSSYLWVLPIPRDEMNANPNMVQNVGY